MPLGETLVAEVLRLGSAVDAHESRANVWLASHGSTTPLHYDERPNFFAMVRGLKRISLIPPERLAAQRVYPASSAGRRQSQRQYALLTNRSAAPDADAAALLGGAAATSMRVREGQWLFVPPFWSHEVTTLDSEEGAGVDDGGPSVSVSIWVDGAERTAAACLHGLVPPAPQAGVAAAADDVGDRVGAAVAAVRAIERRSSEARAAAHAPLTVQLTSRFDATYASIDAAIDDTDDANAQLCGTPPGQREGEDAHANAATSCVARVDDAHVAAALLADHAEALLLRALAPTPALLQQLRHMLPLLALRCFERGAREQSRPAKSEL